MPTAAPCSRKPTTTIPPTSSCRCVCNPPVIGSAEVSLLRLSLTGVRNLHPVSLHPSPRINILYGANGSGKTSVLEAVHLLGMARSFRSQRLQPVIQAEQSALTVFVEIQLPEDRKSTRLNSSHLHISYA